MAKTLALFTLLVVVLVSCQGNSKVNKVGDAANRDSAASRASSDSTQAIKQDPDSSPEAESVTYDLSKIFGKAQPTNEGLMLCLYEQTYFIDSTGIRCSIPCFMLPTPWGFRYSKNATHSYHEPDTSAKECVGRHLKQNIWGDSYQGLINQINDFKAVDYDCDFGNGHAGGYESSEESAILSATNSFISISSTAYWFNPSQAHPNHSEQKITMHLADYFFNGYPFKSTSQRMDSLFRSFPEQDVRAVNKELYTNWKMGKLEDDYFDAYRPEYTGDTLGLVVPDSYLVKPLLSKDVREVGDVWKRETRYPLITHNRGRYLLHVYCRKHAGYVESGDYDWTVKARPIPVPNEVIPAHISEAQRKEILNMTTGVKDFYVSPRHTLMVLESAAGMEILHIPTGKVLAKLGGQVTAVEWCREKYIPIWLSEMQKR